MKPLLCFAHGHGDSWEAICLDLDIAVQGRSHDEVFKRLNEAVVSYVQDAMKEEPRVARELLQRKAPFYVRAKHVAGFLATTLLSRDKEQRHGYTTMPCAA